jgi:hypothetical protein
MCIGWADLRERAAPEVADRQRRLAAARSSDEMGDGACFILFFYIYKKNTFLPISVMRWAMVRQSPRARAIAEILKSLFPIIYMISSH